MDQLAQLGLAALRVLQRLVNQRFGVCVIRPERSLRELQRDGVHEPLPRAVVQVAENTPPCLVGLADPSRASGGKLVAGVGAGMVGGWVARLLAVAVAVALVGVDASRAAVAGALGS